MEAAKHVRCIEAGVEHSAGHVIASQGLAVAITESLQRAVNRAQPTHAPETNLLITYHFHTPLATL